MIDLVNCLKYGKHLQNSRLNCFNPYTPLWYMGYPFLYYTSGKMLSLFCVRYCDYFRIISTYLFVSNLFSSVPLSG